MSSVARKYGFFWETLWNHPNNAELKKVRADPNALHPGDEVHIPDLRIKSLSKEPNQRHVFRRKGVPALFQVRLLDGDQVRSGEAFELWVDGKKHTGTTDGDGWIKVWIPPNATTGSLLLQDGAETYDLDLGRLDPVEELSGVQGRLKNLGWYEGSIDGTWSSELEAAVYAFQREYGISPTGEIDETTRSKIKELHAR